MMKSTIFSVVCFLMTTPSFALSQAANLLSNPGFENVHISGYLHEWQINSSCPIESMTVVKGDPSSVRSGIYSVKLVQNQKDAAGIDKFGAFFTSPAIPVKPLTGYTVSFWTKGEGKVLPAIYCYGDKENISGPVAELKLFKVKEVDEKAFCTLGKDAAWKECRYTFYLAAKNTKVTSIRLAFLVHGTVFLDDCSLVCNGPVSATSPKKEVPQKDASDILVRPNLMSVNRVSHVPVIDGTILPNEYPNASMGLINCDSQSLYPQSNGWYMGYDEQNFYFALSVKLPAGTKDASPGTFRDDNSLIAAPDTFYMFIRTDKDTTAQQFEGAYFAVSFKGIVYDAWETMDHVKYSCVRDASFNADTKMATSKKDGIWTIEMAIPWKDMKFPMPKLGNEYAMSFGLNVNNQRLAWQSHPTWYDYPQAFGLFRIAGESVQVKTPMLDGLTRGRLAPDFDIANQSAKELPYSVSYIVSDVKMTDGSVASWVLDSVTELKQREAIANKSFFYWQRSGMLQPDEQKKETDISEIKNPGYYVLEMEARTDGTAYFYQKVPFKSYPPIDASFIPVPSKNIILTHLMFYGADAVDRGKIRISFEDSKGKVVLTQEATISGDEMELPVSMASLKPGEYQVRLVLTNLQGKEVATRLEKFKKWETPVWLKHHEGIEALNPDWVPNPWTPIEVKGGRVSIWGRTFDFGSGSLLAGMTSQNLPLMGEGMTAKYISNGKEQGIKTTVPAFPMKKRGCVEVTQEGDSSDFTLSSKAYVEFDGLLRYEITITPKKNVKVDKLWISIPFAEMKYAFYSNGGNQWKTGLINSLDLTGPGRWYVAWFGTDKVGCSFLVENHKGWLINSTKSRIVLKNEGNSNLLQLLIVNEPSEVTKPLAFKFAIQPTPFKPPFKTWRDSRTDGLGMNKPPINLNTIHAWAWNSGDSKPSPRNWKAFRDMLDYLHKNNRQRVYPYIGTYYLTPYNHIRSETPFIPQGQDNPPDMLVKSRKDATRVEEYFYYKQDWDLMPPMIHDVGMETQQEVRTSPSSSYADFFLYGMAEMLRKSDVDGFFCDIPTSAIDFNEEKGNSYLTKDGVLEGTYELLANRDLYKRLYYLFEKYRGPARKPYIIGHGVPYFPAVLSFWDIVGHGEEVKPDEPFACTKIYLQKSGIGNPIIKPDPSDENRTYDAFYFRAFFLPHAGVPSFLLPQYGYNQKLYKPEFARELLSFTFTHNILIWPAYVPQSVVYDFLSKVEVPFGMGDTMFYPYWENDVKSQPKCIKVSYWKKDGREEYLVAVANWSDKTVDANISLPPTITGFKQCSDMESGEKISTKKEWKITVPSHNLRVFRFGGENVKSGN